MTDFWKWQGWEGEKPCPEARMLVSEVDLDLASRVDPEVLKRIRQGLADPRASEQIAAAIEFRRQIASSFDIDRLRQFVTHLRNRYRVAGDLPVSIEDAALPSVASLDDSALLAETESLLERLKTIYTLSSMRDRQVSRFRYGALWVLAVLLGFVVAARLLGDNVSSHTDHLINLCVVALFGAVGSMVSIMRRSQRALDLGPIGIDPVQQISALRHGFSGMLIGALVGPVLALVLFAVFAGKMLIIPGLTPEFTEQCGVRCSFSFDKQPIGFVSVADAARMAIWAFLAGFAEQLVPDVLDKFTKAARSPPDKQVG